MYFDFKKRIFGLDLMRSVAILFVMASHILYIFPESSGSFVDLLRLCGVMGVEIFFVLSGFLIGRILFRICTKDTFLKGELGYFLVRRWFRTLPNYYLILLINIGVVLFLGRDLPETLARYFGFVQNFTTRVPVFFNESWSLSIEEFAYILGPLLLYLTTALGFKVSKRKQFLAITLLIIITFIITKVYYNAHTSENTMTLWNEELKAVLVYRIDAIYYGVLAAFISEVYSKFWKSYAAVLFIFGVVAFFAFQFLIPVMGWYIESHPFVWNVVYLPYNSLCIALLLPALSRKRNPSKFIRYPITIISVISYSMYLLHYSIILQMMRYYIPIEELSFLQKTGYSLGYFLITIVLSYILYRLFEKPVMDLRDHPRVRRLFNQPTPQ